VKRSLLIVNSQSGSASAVELPTVQAALTSAGLSIDHVVQLPDDDCPDLDAVEELGVEVVIILSGDGTVASLCEKLSDWDGSLLILPGGTMNLLSRRLHGDAALPELLEKMADAKLTSVRVPIICLGKRQVLTGLTVGPSTRWGRVREGIRHGDVASLAEVVPEAWSETLSDDGVWVEGHQRQGYAGVFVEPHDEATLSVVAFRANNIGDMIGHGIAWLRRDFREGPKDEIGVMRNVVIVGDDPETGLLIDGEYEDGRLPVECSAGLSSVNFLKLA
jgi:Diacylglycerol kinase catalytic domain